jgi:hypothetical protein
MIPLCKSCDKAYSRERLKQDDPRCRRCKAPLTPENTEFVPLASLESVSLDALVDRISERT